MFRLPLYIYTLLISFVAFAVDGVILIDQNRALVGNVTPSDSPGFPVSITQPGSYKLSGNLTLPDANTSGIVISASNVTIDLGGFTILGPLDCSAANCTPAFLAGIASPQTPGFPAIFNITIRNGTIQGIGRDGISLHGGGFLVEGMHIRSNANAGITLQGSQGGPAGSVVRHNTVERNTTGIDADCALVEGNTLQDNRNIGIIARDSARVVNNVIRGSSSYGLFLTASSSYTGNILLNNVGTQIIGGYNMGQNICGSSPCPSAVN